MPGPIVILEEIGSTFSTRLAGAIASAGSECIVRSIDAAFTGAPVTMGDGRVTWDGVELLEAGAIFLERPLFSWPQPARLGTLAVPREDRARVAEREARSLTISALTAASATRRVVNRPGTGTLAASRAAALVSLETATIPVHPWSVTPAPFDEGNGALFVDLVGRERWHRPARPPAGDHCLRLEPIGGELFGLMMAGGEPAGAWRYASAEAWAAQRGGELSSPERIPAGLAETGARAAAALDLEVVEVWLTEGSRGPEVLLVEPGPDLSAWDAGLQGGVANRIARLLTGIAESTRGED